MTRVKICGITNEKDALYACEQGADALGFIFYKGSKRYIAPQKALKIIKKLPPFVIRVGVFVNESWESMMSVKEICGLDRIQIHTDTPEKADVRNPGIAILAFSIKSKEDILKAGNSSAVPLLDSFKKGLFGGTGERFDWKLLKAMSRPYILAGGISPDNIEKALMLSPYAIDIASGVEKEPGIKDHKKMFEIFRKLRENQIGMKRL